MGNCFDSCFQLLCCFCLAISHKVKLGLCNSFKGWRKHQYRVEIIANLRPRVLMIRRVFVWASKRPCFSTVINNWSVNFSVSRNHLSSLELVWFWILVLAL